MGLGYFISKFKYSSLVINRYINKEEHKNYFYIKIKRKILKIIGKVERKKFLI